MPTRFTELLAGATWDAPTLRLSIPDDWMQGRTTYGGLSTALCLTAAQRGFHDLPQLRSANVTFVGPAGGPVEVRPAILRQGRSVSFVAADLSSEKGLATRCAFAFGAPRESTLEASWSPAPEAPPPDACEPFLPLGQGPTFTQHFDTRLVRGARPGGGTSAHCLEVWVRHRDGSAKDAAALVALADTLPPAVLPMATEFKPISSMTWMFNLLSDAPATDDEGWWLLQARAEHAANGYSSQDMLVWNRAGECVMAGRQSVAIFF